MRLRIVFGSYLGALTALTIFFVWPIYQDWFLLVTALVALGVGIAIGANQKLRQGSITNTAMLSLLAYVLLALPLANPRALLSTNTLLSGFLEAVAAPVQSWKQIITIDLPLGTYHALLAPVLVIYLLSGVLFGWLLFGKVTHYWLASIPVLVIVIFAIAFGVTSVPGDFNVFGLAIPLPTPVVSGSSLFLALVVYLNWGARATRREKLLVGKDSLGLTSNFLVRKARRFAMASGVVVLGIAVVATSMQYVGVSNNRTVLRSGVEKIRALQQQTSPLSTYRMYFNDSELLQRQLLTYSIQSAPTRIRLATMPYFNGESFTVAPTAGSRVDDSTFFARVPSEIATRGNGETESFTIGIGKLDSIWLPIVANVKRINFVGDRATELGDTLFLNRVTGTAAIIPGTSNNANYKVDYVTLPDVQPEDILPTGPTIDETYIPESLKIWLASQPDISISDGSGMVAIAKRLRDRGFLSHGLKEPSSKTSESVNWVTAVEGLDFQQSTAGHNVSRLEQLFKDLNSQQERVGKRGNLVASAGDDEQFAAAIALVATAKGFPARVVVGFRTGKAEEVPGVPVCSENGDIGICTGANLSAWAEIQGSSGEWLAIDATPQFEKPLTLVPPPPGTPKNPTDAGEDSAGVLPPGKSVPSTDSNCLKNPEKCKTPPKPAVDQFVEFLLNYVVPIAQGLGVFMIFSGPFLLILAMKRRRLRSRRRHQSEYAQIVGAWEEYVDVAVDFGAEIPRNRTRLELARASENADVVVLAELANEMAFGSSEFESVDRTDEEIKEISRRSWQIFESERERLRSTASWVDKLRAAFSLRSFIRQAKPKDQLRNLSSKFRFSQSGRTSEGSGFSALLQAIQSQLRSMLARK